MLSANSTAFISNLAIQFSSLRIAYILLVIAIGWFFKSQSSEGFRQAIAESLNLDEGELIIILFCLLIGALIGGFGTWINQAL